MHNLNIPLNTATVYHCLSALETLSLHFHISQHHLFLLLSKESVSFSRSSIYLCYSLSVVLSVSLYFFLCLSVSFSFSLFPLSLSFSLSRSLFLNLCTSRSLSLAFSHLFLSPIHSSSPPADHNDQSKCDITIEINSSLFNPIIRNIFT